MVLGRSQRHTARAVYERNKIVENLQRRLAHGTKGSGKRGRFLTVNRDAVVLNEEAIDRDVSFDGRHGVRTSLLRDKHAAQDSCGCYGRS